MNSRDLKVRETMARVARVRDQRAATRLSAAITAELQKKDACDGLTRSRDHVREASERCLEQSSRLDLARYALLADLQGILDTQVAHAEHSLASAVAERELRTSERLMTRSRHERADEEAVRYRNAMHQDIEKKQAEQSVELWLQHGDTA